MAGEYTSGTGREQVEGDAMSTTTRMHAAVLPFRVVSEYKRLVVFRLGKMIGTKGPGIVSMRPAH